MSMLEKVQIKADFYEEYSITIQDLKTNNVFTLNELPVTYSQTVVGQTYLYNLRDVDVQPKWWKNILFVYLQIGAGIVAFIYLLLGFFNETHLLKLNKKNGKL